MLAEKEIINVALQENYLLKQQLSGQASEGEEDVKYKCLRVALAGSDDPTGHPDQEGQEPPKEGSCTTM